ncbi:MAG TPA: DoxX family protein [Gemmatimonadales bacterium]|nr:DoxX family protein [Gemmatimonadales bacterium]
MNALTPYAAFFMRLAVGLVFLQHGWYKFHHMGVGGVAGMLHGIGFPFATIFAVILIAVETIGAVCVVVGFYTRFWATCMAVEMLVAILAVQLRKGAGFEVEGLLFAGAVTLIALGDGPLSIAVKLKHSST